MATNKIFFIQLLVVLLFISCENRKAIDNEIVVLKIGDFSLSKNEFDDAIFKIEEIKPEFTREEIELIAFDNFIGAGILVESAKKKSYDQSTSFKSRYEKEFQKKLIIRHNQYLRTRKNDNKQYNYYETLNYQDKGLSIDYIRIPRGQKVIAKKMYVFFKSGASYSDIRENPDYELWKSLGISFHEEISFNSAIFTKNVFDKVAPLNNNDVVLIKENTSYYIVRMKQSNELPYEKRDKKIYLLNILMGECVENGELVFDPFVMKNLIKCNNELLSKINFSIPPMIGNTNGDNGIIANLNGKRIPVDDVRQEIKELPIKFQCLFSNESIKKQAIATLLLINFNPVLNPDSITLYSKKLKFENALKSELAKTLPSDTTEFLKTWITNNINSIKSGLVVNNTGVNSNILSGGVNLKNETMAKKIKTIEDWLTPEKYLGSDVLKLNFEAIEALDFQQDITKFENMVIAKYYNWHLTVKEFLKELHKLTPRTRIDIAKNNLSFDLIEYLAKRDTKTKAPHVTINPNLLNKINLIGNSYDSLNVIVNESDTVAILGSTTLTVKDTRLLFEELSKRDKEELIMELDMRKNFFNEKLVDQFWLECYDTETLKYDSPFIKAKKYCQNIILAEMFYEKEIKIPSFEIDDNEIKTKFNIALNTINKDRLDNFLQQKASEFPIEVNVALLKDKYRFDLTLSRFSKNIKKI